MTEKKIIMEISITHFINPHHFYFKNTDSKNDCLNFENEITNECENKTVSAEFVLKPGDIVAVFIPKKKSWIRARIDQKTDSKCNLWAIDRGAKFETSIQMIRPLSMELQKRSSFSKCGSSMNCLPARLEYDFNKNVPVLNACNSWSESAIKTIKELIKQAEKTMFHIHYTIENQNFGYLTFQLGLRNIDSNNTLRLINQAVKRTSVEFRKDIETLQTFTHFRSMDCKAILSKDTNKDLPTSDTEADLIKTLKSKEIEYLPTNADIETEVLDKIASWYERNDKIMQQKIPGKGSTGYVSSNQSKQSGTSSISSDLTNQKNNVKMKEQDNTPTLADKQSQSSDDIAFNPIAKIAKYYKNNPQILSKNMQSKPTSASVSNNRSLEAGRNFSSDWNESTLEQMQFPPKILHVNEPSAIPFHEKIFNEIPLPAPSEIGEVVLPRRLCRITENKPLQMPRLPRQQQHTAEKKFLTKQMKSLDLNANETFYSSDDDEFEPQYSKGATYKNDGKEVKTVLIPGGHEVDLMSFMQNNRAAYKWIKPKQLCNEPKAGTSRGARFFKSSF